jgi:hypothetical protein
MALIEALRSPERFSADLNRSDEFPEMSSTEKSDVFEFAHETVLKSPKSDFR